METWKPVLGFETLYEVSDCGNVRRTARSKTLDASKVPTAKQMFDQGATLKQVADFLETSVQTAHSIKHGKTWNGDARHRQVCGKPDSRFYIEVTLSVKGVQIKKRVHRLMWEAFNGPIQDKLEINHKNLNRSDNRLANLELVTHRENIQHAIDLYKEKGLLRAVKGVKGFIAGRHSEYHNR